MRLLNVVSAVLCGVVLTGCAARPKPELSNEDYQRYTRLWAVTHYCNNKGWLSPELAATGIRILRANLSSYTTDPDRFDREVAWFAGHNATPTQGECNQMAMEIAGRSQQVAENHRASDELMRRNQEALNSIQGKQSQTYCNKVGTQTFCNTY